MASSRNARATFAKPAAQPEPEINVTPLVDVVLVLLIIFMVIAPNLQEGTPVTLPIARTVDEKSAENGLEVVVTADGKLHLDKAEMSQEALVAELSSAREKDPTRPLVLKADAALPYEKIRDVFAMLQRRGFAGVSLKVEKPKDGAS
jgi:biopolymer transport protein TolR